MAYDWISLLIVVGLFVLSAMPLHRAVKIMKGKTTFLKTLVVMIVAGIVVGVMTMLIEIYAGFVAFVIFIWFYHYFFRLKWHRAVQVWALHLAIIIMSSIIVNFALEVFRGLFS